jgi:glycosyltransferase involved in cell wall biosynthesis
MFQKPFNVLQTCFSYSWGGLEQQAYEVSVHLQERGHRVWLACCAGSRLEQEARKGTVTVLPLEVKGYFHPLICWQISRLLRRRHVNVIHCQLSKDIATLVPAMLLSQRRIPIILSKRVGSYITKRDLFHRFTYNHVSKILAISDVIHRNVLETTPTPPDRVITLHDAIDTDVFSPLRGARPAARAEFGFTERNIVIGMVGRFSPGKGHEELIEAAHILRQSHPSVRLLIVGEASHGEERYEKRVHQLAQQLGVVDLTVFAGFRTDIPQIMSAIDIFAFPSHAESFGVALIEAMAMERAVVSTNCDGVLDIVVEGETGLYVHPRKASELADALDHLITDPRLRERLGKAGRQRVLELFDRRKQMRKIEEIYKSLTEDAGRPESPRHGISAEAPSPGTHQ